MSWRRQVPRAQEWQQDGHHHPRPKGRRRPRPCCACAGRARSDRPRTPPETGTEQAPPCAAGARRVRADRGKCGAVTRRWTRRVSSESDSGYSSGIRSVAPRWLSAKERRLGKPCMSAELLRRSLADAIGTALLVLFWRGFGGRGAHARRRDARPRRTGHGGDRVRAGDRSRHLRLRQLLRAHLNPAEKVSLAAVRRFPWSDVPTYVSPSSPAPSRGQGAQGIIEGPEDIGLGKPKR